MAHRSGGGSHHGGSHHHSSHHGGHGGGSSAPRISKKPFANARKFRYYDRKGRERFIYSDSMPTKPSFITLLLSLIFFIPFIFGGLMLLVVFISSVSPKRSLTPEYEPTSVHISDEANVIDNEDVLEETLQEFEDLTGISPYIMTVYDSEWIRYYDEVGDYAYSMYLNKFSDEQHFLIVYSEPENAADLDYVDWSWEAIQGDDTDRILTESKFIRFQEDLHNDFLRDSVSVGDAFNNAFQNSLSYMMAGDYNKETLMTSGFMSIIWNVIILGVVVNMIKGFIDGRRDYQEVPYEGSAAMAGNASYQNTVPYQNNTTFQGDMTTGGQYNTAGTTQYGSQYNAAGTQQYGSQYDAAGTQQYGSQYDAAGTQQYGNQYNTAGTTQYGNQYNSTGTTQYDGMGTSQYGTGLDNDYFNDDSRYRSPEYYDDDSRYRGSTAYDGDKK